MKKLELSFVEVALVRKSYAAIDADLMDVLATFYERLKLIEPSFKIKANAKHEVTNRAIISMLVLVIARLDSLASLAMWLKPLGTTYHGRGIHDYYFASVGNALLQTLGFYLGSKFDRMTSIAWLNLYSVIVSHMQEGVNAPEPMRVVEKLTDAELDYAALGVVLNTI
jgi:hemoglobin-like flavoprotein